MSGLKQHLPTVLIVIFGVNFMNAKSSSAAAMFGMLTLIVVAWLIVQNRKLHQTSRKLLFHLGRMQPIGPARMRGWQMLAAVAFVLLGMVMAFGPEGWNSPARWGMAIMCWAIAGAQLSQIPFCYRWGVLLFGVGFVAAGLLLLTEAWVVLQSGQENAALTATKWAVFSSFLLIGGAPVVIGFIRGQGKTPVYEEGLVGPHGFVSWEAAETVELVGADSSHPELHVGAYNGWTLSIRVPSDQIDAVSSFVNVATLTK
ncbi:MAG: hypothetical protein WD049_01140 [Candidatus Paceibacterota bacterium]